MPPRSRRPQPALISRALPRADKLAALLAVSLAAPACCRSPFDPPTPAERETPWWSRLTASLRCAITRDEKPTAIMTPPGAIAIAQPVAPDPAIADGMTRTVQPMGVAAVATPNPPGATTTPGEDDHGRHARGASDDARRRSPHERDRTR
jgi:hypothetical protein